MPSPFPGMDPYLEAAEFWHDVHQHLILLLYTSLNAQLPVGFAAHIEQRVYVTRPDSLNPDVAITRFATAPNLPKPERTTTSVATVSAPRRLQVPLLEVELPRIEIVTARGKRQVVTAIEVLSPINKRGEGREQYVAKQQQLLKSETHLLEIDLLRGGLHTVAAPEVLLRAEASWDYLVCLHRAGDSSFFYWNVLLAEPLPTILIPVTDELPDVPFDLQAAFTQIYDLGPFSRELDYSQEPTPRLSHESAAWADTLLRAKGLRA